MFKVAIGQTEDPDTLDAINEAIEQCRQTLGESQPKAGLIMGLGYDYPVILKRIRDVYPNIKLAGSTTSGEFSSNQSFVQGSLLLILFASDTIDMTSVVARDISKNAANSIAEAVATAKKELKSEPVLCLAFTDVLSLGSVEVTKELRKNLGENFPIFGGCAGGTYETLHAKKLFEFYNDEQLQDCVSMLFFAGPLEYRFTIGSGWKPFTVKKFVIEHTKNLIHKIGDYTGVEFYQHYLGGPPSIAYPLAIYEEGLEKFYLREPIIVDDKTGTLILDADMPEVSHASISQAETHDIINTDKQLMQEANKKLGTLKPAVTFIISCGCRSMVLGTKTKDEYDTLKSESLPNVPFVGGYYITQICPFQADSPSYIHSVSVVILHLGEANK